MKFGSIDIDIRFILFRLLRAVVVMYVVIFAIQRYLVFPAYIANNVTGELQSPEHYNLTGFAEVSLTDSDGVHVMGWSHAPAGNMPVILYFHGNASTINMRAERYRHFIEAGYGVFALSFRGYGKSEGSPSEEGLYNDARAAIDWINHNYSRAKIIVYGESLGSGVAVEMAKEYPIYGVVLQSAYTSVADVAAETYWFMPGAHYLVRDPFDSLSKIASIHCPVLILHGDRDNVIPLEHGKTLAAKANEPKRFILVPGAGHMNIPDQVIVAAMKDFFILQTTKKETLYE